MRSCMRCIPRWSGRLQLPAINVLVLAMALLSEVGADEVMRFLADFEASGAPVTMERLRSFAAKRSHQTVQEQTAAWPSGPYKKTCENCTLDGVTLACSCNAAGNLIFTSIVLDACSAPVSIFNRGGYLHCNWTTVPPPRVGGLSGSPDVHHQCRILEQTTFVAPQMMPFDEPLSTRPASSSEDCCKRCTQMNVLASATTCRAWTLHDGTCTLLRTSNTAYPCADCISGYPVAADSASFCTLSHYNTFNKGAVYDRSMAADVSCQFLKPSDTSFPRAWRDVGQHAMNDTRPHDRGTAWLFLPEKGGHCNCVASQPPGNTTCTGAAWTEHDTAKQVTGRPWAVFIHGGRFIYLNALQQGYAMLASRVAAAGNVGVLAVDYRTAHNGPGGSLWPGGVQDLAAAVRWLVSHKASAIYLYGDSSGSTIVVELMLYLARHDSKTHAKITGAVLFSPWLDLTDSGPGYFSRRSCDIQSTCGAPVMWPAVPMCDRADGQCAVVEYLPPGVPISNSLVSPMHALPSELAQLPPLLMVAGGDEVLLPENFVFAQRLSAVGGSVQVEVWEGMWHDFIEHSEGCNSGMPLDEAVEAMQVVGKFLQHGALRGGCKTSMADAGIACVRWHTKYNTLPPVVKSQCTQDTCADGACPAIAKFV